MRPLSTSPRSARGDRRAGHAELLRQRRLVRDRRSRRPVRRVVTRRAARRDLRCLAIASDPRQDAGDVAPVASLHRRRAPTCRPSRTTCRPADQTSRTTRSSAAKIQPSSSWSSVSGASAGLVAVDRHQVGERRPAAAPRSRGRAPGRRRRAPPRRACAPTEAPGRGQHVAGAVRQALAVFEAAQLLGQRDADVRIRADAERAAGRQVGRAVEDAVAEVRLGDRAEPGHRPRAGEPRRLVGGHLGGVDQAPARARSRSGRAGTRPAGRRARPRPVADLLHLLGGVDVQRAVGERRHQLGELCRAWWRAASAAPRRARVGGQVAARRLAQREEAVEVVAEAAAGRRPAAPRRRRRSCRAPAAASGRCRSPSAAATMRCESSAGSA